MARFFMGRKLQWEVPIFFDENGARRNMVMINTVIWCKVLGTDVAEGKLLNGLRLLLGRNLRHYPDT